jgi:branched-chain amino acid transport system ATP-binding protein
MTAAPLLEVRGMQKAFGGLTAVRDASFAVRRGEIVGLIGPNGSGKTTLINLISGMLKPDGGAMLLAGAEMTGIPAHLLARAGIARTFQLVRVIGEMTALENVTSGLVSRRGTMRSDQAADDATGLMARVGLEGKETVPASDLTYGDQKRVELARALALQPRLLLLDEWLAGLNASELHGGIGLIQSLGDQEGIAIIMVEHVMAAIRSLCPRCIVMNSGSLIADGRTADVMTDPHVIAAYLGDEDV